MKLVAARLVHIGPIATNMRALDRLECEALGRTPKAALRGGLRCSLECFTALDGSRPVAMLGVVPKSLIDGTGTAWMLGTDEVLRFGRELLTLAPPVIASWLGTFRRLENVVALDNAPAIRLLRKWGFDVPAEPQTHGGVTFLPFHIERSAIQAPPSLA